MLGIAIVTIFIFTALFCLLEDRLPLNDKRILYVLIAIILVLLAGFREVGIDPDSDNYEYAYLHYADNRLQTAIEPSYLMISAILNLFTSDVHAIFLFYAFLGVGLKFFAFRKLSEFWFVPVMVYLSFFYELHECTQIRTGIMSGLFLLAIPYLAEKKRIPALIYIALGAFFSYVSLGPASFLILEQ